MATHALPYDSAFDPPAHGRRSSLWPREHGIYVQLLAPLIAALVVAPTLVGVLLAITAGAAFLGTEAVLVARGGRGRRRQAVDGERASHRARTLGTIAAGAGAVGLILAPRPAVELLGLVAIPAVIAMALAARRSIHTFIGEQVAAIALVGASVPILAASGMERTDALLWWVAWGIGFASIVGAVRDVLARHSRRTSAPELDRSPDSHLLAFLFASLLAIVVPPIAIALPLMFAAGVISVAAPSAKRMFTVGIGLACCAGLSTLIAIAVG